MWTSGATEYVYVGGSQHSGCFGQLYGTGTGNGTMSFSGYLTSMPQDGEDLYFFYLGKGGEKSGDALTTLDFSAQDGTLANLTNNHIAVSYGIAYNGSLYFDATFYMMTSFAYFNTSGFGNETVRLHGEQVYSKAIVNFSEGTITGSEKGNISIGSGSNGVYVALIPSTTSLTTLEFDGSTKTGSIDFLRGIQAGRYYCKNGGALEVEASALQQVDLSTLTDDYEAQDGDILTNALAGNNKISIADGATVTLDGVTINGVSEEDPETSEPLYAWAGITCLGDATIILKDGTENTVKGFFWQYPSIYVPENNTLIIKGGSEGSGKLTASSNGYGAGIGGGANIACGNIEIQGGDITATGGGNFAAGIGSAYEASCGAITISGGTVTATGGESGAGIGSSVGTSCGDITISGGTVTATGGYSAAGIGRGYSEASCGAITITGGTVTATGGESGAGIGSGYEASCGAITITTGVTEVTATKGKNAPNSIGAGEDGSCGTVTIGGVETGFITPSPYTYEP